MSSDDDKAPLTEEPISASLTHGSKHRHAPPVEPKTKAIFDLRAPYANEHQGKSRKVVFVCMVGILRSPTAAALASARGMNTRAVGIDDRALIQLNAGLVQWANQIVFFGSDIKRACIKAFPELLDMEHKHVMWPIPDNYDYNDPTLQDMINTYLDELEKMSLYGG